MRNVTTDASAGGWDGAFKEREQKEFWSLLGDIDE